jgi:hypothetical protein
MWLSASLAAQVLARWLAACILSVWVTALVFCADAIILACQALCYGAAAAAAAAGLTST